MSRPEGVIIGKRETQCPDCGQMIRAGQRVRYREGRRLHSECPRDAAGAAELHELAGGSRPNEASAAEAA
jgi:hypothetical protein